MAAAPKRSEFVTVKTTLPTLPFPPAKTRSISTERLLMRPFVPDDLEDVHVLRTQEEVMRWTAAGRIDRDLAETRSVLTKFLPPKDEVTFNFALCLKESGEFIGMGGCHRLQGEWGWPDVGYVFKSQHWGKGYATEFLQGFLKAWLQLRRTETEIEVEPRTMTGVSTEQGQVEEQIVAITEDLNARSQHVLKKCGFKHFLTWRAENTKNDKGELIDLPTFRYVPGRNMSKMEFGIAGSKD